VKDRARRTPRYMTTHYADRGTRFLVFPQLRSLRSFRAPVTVHLPDRPGSIKAGPRDATMYVVDALGKPPYFSDGVQRHSPPYRGPRAQRRARPRGGHFDHIAPRPATAREFSAAMMYATIRLTLTVWERYLGRKIRWYFRRRFARLEIIPRISSGTAFSRPGYIECGFASGRPLCENFDVVSHETGHMILRSVIGHPEHPEAVECRAREEAFADIISMVTLLHFEKVVQHLLGQTRGNLFSRNVLTNLGEISRQHTLRRVFNRSTLGRLTWIEDQTAFKYALAEPLAGAVFDILVDLYEEALVKRNAISRQLADDSFDALGTKQRDIQRQFNAAYEGRHAVFEDALLEARDQFGMLLARTWRQLSMHDLYPNVAASMIAVALQMGGDRMADTVFEAFALRDILPSP
jgi:hypothetical protein